MNMIKYTLQISNGAAQRGRNEGAVLPVRRSAPEHNPYMTSKQHSTTARWIRLGVNISKHQQAQGFKDNFSSEDKASRPYYCEMLLNKDNWSHFS